MIKSTILLVEKDEVNGLLPYVKRVYFDCNVSCIEIGECYQITIEELK